MRTLVLGHGKFYLSDEDYDRLPKSKKDQHATIRCSPIKIEDWYTQPYICVDIDTYIRPDIVYDLRRRPWVFAENESFDRVIDTCGIAFVRFNFYDKWFLDEVLRILKPGGIFYGRGDNRIQKS